MLVTSGFNSPHQRNLLWGVIADLLHPVTITTTPSQLFIRLGQNSQVFKITVLTLNNCSRRHGLEWCEHDRQFGNTGSATQSSRRGWKAPKVLKDVETNFILKFPNPRQQQRLHRPTRCQVEIHQTEIYSTQYKFQIFSSTARRHYKISISVVYGITHRKNSPF